MERQQVQGHLKSLLWVTCAAAVVGLAASVTLDYAGLGSAKWAFFIGVIPGMGGIVAALRLRKNNRHRDVRPDSFLAKVPPLTRIHRRDVAFALTRGMMGKGRRTGLSWFQ